MAALQLEWNLFSVFDCMFIIMKRAIVIQGEEDEDGKQEPLSAMDFSLHFLTFFWKVLFAFVPPR